MGSKDKLLKEIQDWFDEAHIPERSQDVIRGFCTGYVSTVLSSGKPEEFAAGLFCQYIKLIRELSINPIAFEPYHQMIERPTNYYDFGIQFAKPLINTEVSEYIGIKNLEKICKQIEAGENVIFLANHQTEIDPHIVDILIQKEFEKLGKEMIYVAGDRVISDHLAIPLSLGRNLLCIYSKKHINNPPEKKEEKRLHNKKTMQLMSQLLSEGGKCIYVAPSGGRDRPNSKGEFHVAPFDAQSIEMFYLMTKRAKTTTHFYPLTLLTYRVLPPPNDVEVEVGEERFAKYAGVYASFGEEIDMDHFPGHAIGNKLQHRNARSDYIWSLVAKDYERLKEIKDQNEKHL